MLLDFALAPGKVSYSTYKWDGFGTAFMNNQSLLNRVLVLSCPFRPLSSEPDQEIDVLNKLLYDYADRMTDKQVSQVMSYIAERAERREAARQAANPDREAGLERASARFAERTAHETVPIFDFA